MNHTQYLAELDMTGPYGPLIWALVITIALAAFVSGWWTWWRSPARIQKLLRRDGLGLIELKDHFHLCFSDWLWSFLIALALTIALFVSFYFLLIKDEYLDLDFWNMLANSMMHNNTVFSEYHPMPYGILIAVVCGLTLGRLLGLAFGKNLGAKRVLLTSRLHRPLKH
jgi:hypothetical protein